MRLVAALLFGIVVVAPAIANDSTPPALETPKAPTVSRDFTKEPGWCKPDRKGNHPIKPNCPFDPKMKFAADGPYEIKKLSAAVTALFATQISARMQLCDDPIDALYGVLTRYHGATMIATRRGILVDAQKMHPLRMQDYMDPSKKWDALDENAYTCESIERAAKAAKSEANASSD